MLEGLLIELEEFADDFRQPRIKEIAEEIRCLTKDSIVRQPNEPENPEANSGPKP